MKWICVAIGACLQSIAFAQTAPLDQEVVAVTVDSGPIVNRIATRGVIFSHLIEVPEATWIRILFDEIAIRLPLMRATR